MSTCVCAVDFDQLVVRSNDDASKNKAQRLLATVKFLWPSSLHVLQHLLCWWYSVCVYVRATTKLKTTAIEPSKNQSSSTNHQIVVIPRCNGKKDDQFEKQNQLKIVDAELMIENEKNGIENENETRVFV